jgi:hypothetical protein
MLLIAFPVIRPARYSTHSAASLNSEAAPNSFQLSTNAPPCYEANCRRRIAS